MLKTKEEIKKEEHELPNPENSIETVDVAPVRDVDYEAVHDGNS